MTDRNHHPLASILAHEDLDEHARQRADEHLATCAECRSLLTRLQEIETRASRVAGLPATDEPLAELTPSERNSAGRSRRELLHRVAGRSDSRKRSWLPAGIGGALALAAALTLVLFAPWRDLESERGAEDGFHNLRLVPSVVVRDEPGTGAGVAADEPVSIRFTPARSGWPVVLRVEATGVEVLCPTAQVPGWHLDAGLPAVVPPPGSAIEWRAGPSGAATRWLVALTPEPLDDPVAFARDVESATDIDQWLADRFGPVGVVTR